MSMMVNPVSMSSVRFCGGTEGADILGRPGKFANANPSAEAPAAEKAPKKKSHKLLKTIVGLAVVAGALVALPKAFPNAIKVLGEDAMKNATFTQKAGHYLATVGEAIGKYTYEPIAKLFKGKEKEVAEAATNVVE